MSENEHFPFFVWNVEVVPCKSQKMKQAYCVGMLRLMSKTGKRAMKDGGRYYELFKNAYHTLYKGVAWIFALELAADGVMPFEMDCGGTFEPDLEQNVVFFACADDIDSEIRLIFDDPIAQDDGAIHRLSQICFCLLMDFCSTFRRAGGTEDDFAGFAADYMSSPEGKAVWRIMARLAVLGVDPYPAPEDAIKDIMGR